MLLYAMRMVGKWSRIKVEKIPPFRCSTQKLLIHIFWHSVILILPAIVKDDSEC